MLWNGISNFFSCTKFEIFIRLNSSQIKEYILIPYLKIQYQIFIGFYYISECTCTQWLVMSQRVEHVPGIDQCVKWR